MKKLTVILSLLFLTLLGSSMLWSTDNCLHFDGDNDYVNLGDIDEFDGVSKLSVEMWVRIDDWVTWRTFFSKAGAGQRIQFQLYSTEGNLGIAIQPGVYVYTDTEPIYTGEWFHLAMIFDGTQAIDSDKIKLYVNGNTVPLYNLYGDYPITTPNNSGPVLLGAENASAGREFPFEGKMDEVRFWSDAKSQQEVVDRMNSILTGNEPNLIMYFQFNQGVAGGDNSTVATLMDSSVNGYNGNLTNFALSGSSSNWVESNRDVAVFQPSTNIAVNNNVGNQVTIDWDNGSAIRRAVFMKQTNSGSPIPVNSVTYYANNSFGAGDQIGTSGWVSVYDGTASSVTVNNLTNNTDYRIMVCDYNGGVGNQVYTTAPTENENIISFTTAAAIVAEIQTTTLAATDITATSANVTGNVFNANGTITARGFKVSTTMDFNPVNMGSVYSAGSGNGIFNTTIGSLTEGVTYYYVAYATTANGTVYGSQRSFTTAATSREVTIQLGGSGITKHNGTIFNDNEDVVVPDSSYPTFVIIASNGQTISELFDSVEGVVEEAAGLTQYTYTFRAPISGRSDRTLTVTFSDGETLPVTLSYFDAVATSDNLAEINWTTQSESNLAGFNIYRATDEVLRNSVLLNSSIVLPTNSAVGNSYSFIDKEFETNCEFYYWLESVEIDGTNTFYGPISLLISENSGGDVGSITEFTGIKSICPNPFNPTTTVMYYVRNSSNVSIDIYNTRGQLVNSYNLGHVNSDTNGSFVWNGNNSNNKRVASGAYLIKLNADSQQDIKRVILLK